MRMRDPMIKTKTELNEFILADAKANRRKTVKANLFGDDVWKFQRLMRHLDYYAYKKNKSPLYIPLFLLCKYLYHRKSIRLGFSIPYNNIGKGLSIPHFGTIVINNKATIGNNCRIHVCVNIGATSNNPNAPKIGNNVYIAPGVKLVGDIEIADDVAIGAGAVVVKSITEPGTTWAGVPAVKISDNSSRDSLSPILFEE